MDLWGAQAPRGSNQKYKESVSELGFLAVSRAFNFTLDSLIQKLNSSDFFHAMQHPPSLRVPGISIWLHKGPIAKFSELLRRGIEREH